MGLLDLDTGLFIATGCGRVSVEYAWVGLSLFKQWVILLSYCSPHYTMLCTAQLCVLALLFFMSFFVPFTITLKFEVSADRTWGSWGGSVVVYCGSIASPEYITIQ